MVHVLALESLTTYCTTNHPHLSLSELTTIHSPILCPPHVCVLEVSIPSLKKLQMRIWKRASMGKSAQMWIQIPRNQAKSHVSLCVTIISVLWGTKIGESLGLAGWKSSLRFSDRPCLVRWTVIKQDTWCPSQAFPWAQTNKSAHTNTHMYTQYNTRVHTHEHAHTQAWTQYTCTHMQAHVHEYAPHTCAYTPCTHMHTKYMHTHAHTPHTCVHIPFMHMHAFMYSHTTTNENKLRMKRRRIKDKHEERSRRDTW